MSEWHVERRAGQVAVIAPDGTADPECTSFLERVQLRGLSRHTAEAYAYDLVLLRRWLDAELVLLVDLNIETLHRFLAWERGRESSAKSINRRLHTLRLFFRHVTSNELPGSTIARSGYRSMHRDRELGIQTMRLPERQALRVKEARVMVEPLTIEQVNELLGSIRRYRDLGIAYLMLLCGLRSQEVLNVRLCDVDADDRRLRVQGKGGKERSVPMPMLLLSVLRKYVALERPKSSTPQMFVVMQGAQRGRAMTRAGLRRIFRTRRQQPTLTNANPHRLRHTFGTDMARSGVRLPILQRMMGHAFPETTLQYVNLSMVDVAAEFQRASEKLEHRYELEGGR